ncbi:MAG TPA: efflux RND transporter periplasmic adaptor subunit [Terracidiphilus sp.]|nr:efflux RND transporter periplasmic adaptor subunit [Terracidiphilus sp.]
MNSSVDSPPGPENQFQPNWSRAWRLSSILVFFLLLLGAAVFIVLHLRTRESIGLSHSMPASASDSQVLRLKGTTIAADARAIEAPLLAGQQIGTLTITHLIPGGTRVKRGDLLVEFDRQEQERNIIDKRSQSSDENDKVLEEQAKEAAARAKDETEMKQAEDDLSKAQLEMQKVELLSRIDAEKAKETLEEAKATLAQLRQTFDLKRKAAQASIRILEIQRDRTIETMMHAEANAALMEIHAPIDGIVVYNTIWKQGSMGEVKEGDQVRPGVPFMQVVDPSIMEVQVPVDQMDVPMLTVGETAQVHLDAYPDLVLHGRLESIDPMGRTGDFSSKLRTFSATFSIQGADPRLMPDLSAAVDVRVTLTPVPSRSNGE